MDTAAFGFSPTIPDRLRIHTTTTRLATSPFDRNYTQSLSLRRRADRARIRTHLPASALQNPATGRFLTTLISLNTRGRAIYALAGMRPPKRNIVFAEPNDDERRSEEHTSELQSRFDLV